VPDALAWVCMHGGKETPSPKKTCIIFKKIHKHTSTENAATNAS
jgi:hypothetical protein